MLRISLALSLFLLLLPYNGARAQLIGTPAKPELVIAEEGASTTTIIVAPDAGPWEKKAASDLSKYIAMMAGPQLPVVNDLGENRPSIVVGKAAIAADRQTAAALLRAAKKSPIVQADAISVRREGDHLYVAGSNDESHYFAVAWLLQQWGCRWYMPTEFGEVIPEHARLSVGAVEFAYSPPFEIRRYWISWNGDSKGADEFQRRNFMSGATVPGYGHALDQYTADLAPAGGSHFNVPFADPRTAEHVAAKIAGDYAAGKDISLAIADGTYSNNHPSDRALVGGYDPYFLKPSLTDAMMTLYNNVGRLLRRRYPESRSKIGAMAYSNATLPPRKVESVEPNIVMWLAPIDIDPNHAMDDPRSPPRREYRKMLERWSKLLAGRLAIYDYDQGMLVWRDLPNPSHHVFAKDVKIYRQAGILGIQTESRGALSTTFLNLFFRGQLMWNAEADVAGLLEEFYPNFYGPAAAPMARYWGRIFNAWERTSVTEHEYLVIPAIYTPELVDALRADLKSAEVALEINKDSPRAPDVYAERLRFTRASFDMIDAYVATAIAAAREADYPAAVSAGKEALKAQRTLRAANTLFTSGLVGGENQSAWLAGEVQQYTELSELTDGGKGTLIARLPLEWSFKVETPLPPGWRYAGQEGPVPLRDARLAREQPSRENGWRSVRVDLYPQAQGVTAGDGQNHLGHYWYRIAVEVAGNDLGRKVHLIFPGLFNEAWLYINGELVAHRSYDEPWWRTDYRFQWDVDISGHIRPGLNEIALRGFNPHHWGGIFRRPFLYRAN